MGLDLFQLVITDAFTSLFYLCIFTVLVFDIIVCSFKGQIQYEWVNLPTNALISTSQLLLYSH